MSVVFPDDLNLAQYFLFDRIAEGFGSKVAVRYGARSYTYEFVVQRARAVRALLEDSGVRRGERVLIVLPDCPPFAWVFFGILAQGAVVAMGNPDVPPESIEYLVGYTRATAIVTVPRVASALRAAREARGVGRELRCIFEVPETRTGEDADTGPLAEALHAVETTRDPVPIHRDEPALWLFTSGSSGEPKANVHTHRDFAFNTEVYAKRTIGYAEGDVTLSVPRLFAGYATGSNLMFPFAVGATVALFSERPAPETVAAAVASYRPTILVNVPTMIGKLLDHDDEARAAGTPPLDLSSVRFSFSAGEALPEALLERWQARFASDIYDGIGSAEMFHIYATNRPGDVKPGSLGRVVDGYELLILPEEAEGPGALPVPAGEIGVLWVKGDSVSQGYWLDRTRSWKTFHGHWCRTGDLFRIDEGGYLFFAGRADDLLKVSGSWVAPIEVEECLLHHPAVSLAAVIGVSDEGLLKPKAFVVLRAGVVAHDGLAVELQAFVKAKLAKYKYPRWVEFVSDLPRNDRGKIDRKALRALEASRQSA